jgi:hypothetical protein
MFISKSRIKKLVKNPLGGVMFLSQYLRSLKLKHQNLKSVDVVKKEWFSLIDNKEFFDFVMASSNTLILDGKINVFGKEVMADGIDWNRDYLNSFSIKSDYYFNLREWIIKNSFKGFDIKNVWQLSRGYYLVDLARAYHTTQDEKYLKTYTGIIQDWIKQNPYLHSSNWTNAMEVAIRSINWIISFQVFNKDKDVFDDEFLKEYYTNLNQSFNFLINNIETYPFKSNHYILDNLGIFMLGLELNNTGWIKKSFNNLLGVLGKQFDTDGVDFENSSNYQILKTEALMMAFLLYKQNLNKLEKIKKVNNACLEQLSNIFNFSIHLFKNTESTFLVGDNDETNVLEIGSLKTKLEKMYLLMFGDEVGQKESKVFFQSGYGFLRNSKFNILFLRSNIKKSSHFHNDLLSFQLNYNGLDFFVDSNTYNYNQNREKRAYYLRTQSHNTCFINGTEQSKIEINDPFLRNTQIKSLCKKSNVSNVRDEMALEAKYNGFSHSRSLVFNKEQNKLSIFDTFTGKIKQIEWNLYCPLGVKIYNNLTLKNVLVMENSNQKLVLELPETLGITISNAFVSAKYNNEELGSNIKLKFENKSNLTNLSFQMIIKENYLN